MTITTNNPWDEAYNLERKYNEEYYEEKSYGCYFQANVNRRYNYIEKIVCNNIVNRKSSRSC